MLSQIKKPHEIEAMRAAGAVLASGLSVMKEAATAGISTQELSDLAALHIKKAGMKPAFLDYPGSGGAPPYPDVACISVNDAVVHGMPSGHTILKDGDIVSLDLGVSHKEMIVDGAITMIVGQASDREKELVETTRKALNIGLKQVKDGCFTGDIGQAVQEVLQSKNLGVVRDLVGHGVGYSIHEDPNIPNFGKSGTGSRLYEGMTVAIEPMATLGGYEVYIDKDGWTVRTRDGSKAAHFEQTILVTKNGYEVLTA